MTDIQRKSISKTTRELYLYPHRSKGENLLRGAVWLASWIIGIAIQQSTDLQALGGSYFIFSASLLLEFIAENKTSNFARAIHNIFSALLFIMLLCALYLIFGHVSVAEDSPAWYTSILKSIPLFAGRLVFIIIFLRIILSIMEIHKFFFDEDAEKLEETFGKHEKERKTFMDHLTGNMEGVSHK